MSFAARKALPGLSCSLALHAVAGLLTACCSAGVSLSRQARSFWTGRWWRWGTWRQSCALGLSATYVALFLFASLCFATGFLHLQTDHETPHHHTHSHADRTAALPDLCDFAQQALLTTILQARPVFSTVLPPGDALALAPVSLTSLRPVTHHAIRAPPVSHV